MLLLIEEVIYLINNKTNLKIKQNIKDGTKIKDKDLLLELTGNPLEILKYERTILNILQRMSGIATLTNSLIINYRLKTPLAATRKTLWGLLDKKPFSLEAALPTGSPFLMKFLSKTTILIYGLINLGQTE